MCDTINVHAQVRERVSRQPHHVQGWEKLCHALACKVSVPMQSAALVCVFGASVLTERVSLMCTASSFKVSAESSSWGKCSDQHGNSLPCGLEQGQEMWCGGHVWTHCTSAGSMHAERHPGNCMDACSACGVALVFLRKLLVFGL